MLCYKFDQFRYAVKARFTGTRFCGHLIITEQFALSLGKEIPYMETNGHPVNTDTFYGSLDVRIHQRGLTAFPGIVK